MYKIKRKKDGLFLKKILQRTCNYDMETKKRTKISIWDKNGTLFDTEKQVQSYLKKLTTVKKSKITDDVFPEYTKEELEIVKFETKLISYI